MLYLLKSVKEQYTLNVLDRLNCFRSHYTRTYNRSSVRHTVTMSLHFKSNRIIKICENVYYT